MANPGKTKINDYIRLDTLDTNVEKFIDEGYVNYVKRTGGQVNQFYSLSNDFDDESGNYRETEVIFSREIFKRVVLTTKLFPIGINPDAITTSLLPRNEFKNDFYLGGRINPTMIENASSSMRLVGGMFKNVRRSAHVVENVRSALSLAGGFLRPPRIDLYAEPVKVKSSLALLGGIFKRTRIAASFLESIKSHPIEFTSLMRGTRNTNDVLELNFNSQRLPQESNKVYVLYKDEEAITLDAVNKLSGTYSLRNLTRKGGIDVRYKDSSTSLHYGKSSLGLDFYVRDIASGGYLLQSYDSIVNFKLNKLDGSQLEISFGEIVNLLTPPNTLVQNTWNNLVLETNDNLNKIFLNGTLLHEYEGPSIIHKIANGNGFVIGNSISGKEGSITNFDRFYITKNVNVITDNTLINKTEEIVASDLDLTTGILEDHVDGVEWKSIVPPEWEERDGKLAYKLIANNLSSNLQPDFIVHKGNNYKLEVTIEPIRLPDITNKTRAILTDGNGLAGYELNLIHDNNSTKVEFKYGRDTLTSYTKIEANKVYKLSVYKIKGYLILTINDVFDSLIRYSNSDDDIALFKPITVGKHLTNANHNFYGYLYNLKLINFYRDTGEFERYYPENLSKVVVLNFEEEYLDEGGPYREWKASKDTLISSYDYKFGNKSLTLSESDSFIKVQRDEGLNLELEDFTFEAWVLPKSFENEGVLLTNGRETLQGFSGLYPQIVINSKGKLALKTNTGRNSGYFVEGTSTLSKDTWSHVAVVRSEGKVSLYVNGVREIESRIEAPSIDFSYNGTFIGNSNLEDRQSNQFIGYIDSLRLINGIPLYLGDSFNVPTSPASTEFNISLLRLTYEKPEEHILLNDNSFLGFLYRKNFLIRESIVTGTPANNRQIDISNYHYKQSYKVTPSNIVLYDRDDTAKIYAEDYLKGSFTVKRCLYIEDNKEDPVIVCFDKGSFNSWELRLRDKKLAIYEDKGTTKLSKDSNIDIEFNKWYVITLVKHEKRFLVFVDGILVLDDTLDVSVLPSTGSATVPLYRFSGNINDIYFSRRAEYFNSHMISYPLYFSRSFSPYEYKERYSTVNSGYGLRDAIYNPYVSDKWTLSFSVVVTDKETSILKMDNLRPSGYAASTLELFISNNRIKSIYKFHNMTDNKLLVSNISLDNESLVNIIFSHSPNGINIYINGIIALHISESLPKGALTGAGYIYPTSSLKTFNYMVGKSYEEDIIPNLGGFIRTRDDSVFSSTPEISEDAYNIVPKGRIVSNTLEYKVKLVPTSVWRSSTYFEGSSGQLVEGFPSIPVKKSYTELWFNAQEFDCTLLEMCSTEDTSEVLYNLSIDSEGYLVALMSYNGKNCISRSTKKVLLNEWYHVRTRFKDNAIQIYLNGTSISVETQVSDDFEPFIEGCNLTLGYSLSKGKYFKGYLDYIKIGRVSSLSLSTSDFNPLEDIFKESKVRTEDLSPPNLNFKYGLIYWDVDDSISVTNNTLTATTSEPGKATYRLDVSDLIFDSQKIWISYNQYNLNSLSKAGLVVRYYCKALKSENLVQVHEQILPIDTCQEQIRRYIIENLVPGISQIELEFTLDKGTVISGIEVIVEDVHRYIRTPTEALPGRVETLEEERNDYGYSFN